MFEVVVKRFFDSAHQLPDSPHLLTKKCANLHGHTYLAIVTICSVSNQYGGMVVDFAGIKEIIDLLDHRFINEIFEKDPDFKSDPTTAENIARWIHTKVMAQYRDRVHSLQVQVCEGWKGEDNSNFINFSS